jgi:hypothetical protein
VNVLFTGDAEHAGHPFVFEALHEKFSGPPSSLGHSAERSESAPGRKSASGDDLATDRTEVQFPVAAGSARVV